MSEPRPLHRLFGLSWSDFFQGTDVEVQLELDLSRRQQHLDVVLIRRGTKPIPWPLPDGFEDLAPHNLITFKSHQESLDGWTLAELIGHGVNYRKQTGPSQQEILPESDVRLYAVCVRFPQNLANAGILWAVGEGVFEVRLPTVATIRVIVIHGLPKESQNAMFHLFSARAESLQYARANFRPRSGDTSTLLLNLYRAYREDPAMATQLEEFVQQGIDELLKELPPEKRMEGIPPERRMEGIPPERRMEGIPPERRMEGIPPEGRVQGLSAKERIKGLPLEDVLSAMSPEEQRRILETLQRRLGKNGSAHEQN